VTCLYIDPEEKRLAAIAAELAAAEALRLKALAELEASKKTEAIIETETVS